MEMEEGKGSIWIAIVVTVLIMLILGGSGYYILDKKNREDKNALESQVANLTQQVDALNAAKEEKAAQPAAATTTTDSQWLYKNTTYGFSLTFNEKWEGYKLKLADIAGSTATYYVCVPTTDTKWTSSSDSYPGMASVFAISVDTKAQWAEAEAEEGGNRSTKIGETSKYVFSYSPAQSGPTDVLNKKLSSDIKNVVATFSAL